MQSGAHLPDTIERSAQALGIQPLPQALLSREALLLAQTLLPIIVVGKENFLAV